MEKYVAFLRGINVGRRHKVPMADLRSELKKLNFQNIATVLNSGNVLFETDENLYEDELSNQLESVFGFPVPTLIRKFEQIINLHNYNPFDSIAATKNIQLYVSFLKKEADTNLSLPWKSEDGSYTIIEQQGKSIFSVLDLSLSNTPKAMEAMEKYYGTEITTRNWNTIVRIMKKASTIQWP